MPVTVVLGAQWGDEGKGKIVDYLAQKADMCVRFSGGDNAGHTVGEFKLHLVPCGIFNPKTVCIIGNGVAVNPESLIKEIDALEIRKVSCRNLIISSKANLIMPWHIILDAMQEEERGAGKIGTTNRGIGPVFSDKIGRFGFRMEDLISKNMEQKLKKLLERAVNILWQVYGYKHSDLKYENVLEDLIEYRDRIRPLIKETEPIIWRACDDGKRLLMEGAQGTFLDPDFGGYPYTTSSSCILAGALQGTGVSWQNIKEVIGVVKAYTTRVCEKNIPFQTEMPDDIAHVLREQAGEYGATTGRARRMGWLDASNLKYAARLNGFTGLAITRMDNLGTLPKANIWDGKKYIEIPCGWGSDINNGDAHNYLNMIARLVGVPIKYISYGPGRDQVIVKKWYSF
ncbi:MAG: adenylosuccinate synthase [Candidatus Nealsonbacteria bacterium]|nr:adenylosuccinate synthase [Candidatus Nealsonbacteria bacterium]